LSFASPQGVASRWDWAADEAFVILILDSTSTKGAVSAARYLDDHNEAM